MDLAVTSAEPKVARQADLGGAGTGERVAGLADILAQRIGRRLMRLAPRESHIPERAEDIVSFVAPPLPYPAFLFKPGPWCFSLAARRRRTCSPPPRTGPRIVSAGGRGNTESPMPRSGADRSRMVARAGRAARLLPYRMRDGRRLWLYRTGPTGRTAGSVVRPRDVPVSATYVELAATTNFSFLRGASHPHEYVAQAAAYGLAGIGIADRNTMAGLVRAHTAALQAKKDGMSIRFLPGVRLVTECGFEAITYPMDREAWGRLCRLLTLGNRRSRKGECRFSFTEMQDAADGLVFIAMPPGRKLDPPPLSLARLEALAATAPGRVWLGASHRRRGDERARLRLLTKPGVAAVRRWWPWPTPSTTTLRGARFRTC